MPLYAAFLLFFWTLLFPPPLPDAHGRHRLGPACQSEAPTAPSPPTGRHRARSSPDPGLPVPATKKDHNDLEEIDQVDHYQERVRLAEHLDRIQNPFHLSLDEMTAEVQNAAEMIRDRNLVWGA